jgi:hypothetical protein
MAMKTLRNMIVSLARWAVANIDRANRKAYELRIGGELPVRTLAGRETERARVDEEAGRPRAGWSGRRVIARFG